MLSVCCANRFGTGDVWPPDTHGMPARCHFSNSRRRSCYGRQQQSCGQQASCLVCALAVQPHCALPTSATILTSYTMACLLQQTDSYIHVPPRSQTRPESVHLSTMRPDGLPNRSISISLSRRWRLSKNPCQPPPPRRSHPLTQASHKRPPKAGASRPPSSQSCRPLTRSGTR